MSRALAAALLAVAVPAAAFASGDAAHDPALDPHGIFWKGLNLAILFGLLFHFLKKPVVDLFVSRRAEIARQLDEARAARDEAQRKLAEFEQRVAAADAEMAALVAKAEEEAAGERELIVKAAREEADRLRDAAVEDIRRATELARRELAAHAAELATERAADILRAQIREDDQRRIMATYIESLGGMKQ